jgi:hypothetical protein
MPVFISHRTVDDDEAMKVYNRLTKIHGIQCWMDDTNANSPPATITREILENINRCTHLLGIITTNTRGSWWVPYEIGVAEQSERAISTYSFLLDSELPEYLWHWPVLKGDTAIDRFAAIYKQERPVVESMHATRGHEKIANSTNFSAARSSAAQFHSKLKSALGQK